MKTATLINIDRLTAKEFCVSEKEYKKLLVIQESESTVKIVNPHVCVVDGDFEHDYHDVQLPDGTLIEALSGYHLRIS